MLSRIAEISFLSFFFPSFARPYAIKFPVFILNKIIKMKRETIKNFQRAELPFDLFFLAASHHHRLKGISIIQRCLVLNSNLATITF